MEHDFRAGTGRDGGAARAFRADDQRVMDDLGSEVFNLKMAVQEYEDRLARLYQTEDRSRWKGPATLLVDLEAADREVDHLEDTVADLRDQLDQATSGRGRDHGRGRADDWGGGRTDDVIDDSGDVMGRGMGGAGGSSDESAEEAGGAEGREGFGENDARIVELKAQVAGLEEDNRVLAEAAGWVQCDLSEGEEEEELPVPTGKSRRLRAIDLLSDRLKEVMASLKAAEEREEEARTAAEEARAELEEAIVGKEELNAALEDVKRDKIESEERADALKGEVDALLDARRAAEEEKVAAESAAEAAAEAAAEVAAKATAEAAATAAAAAETRLESKAVNTEAFETESERALPTEVTERLGKLEADVRVWRKACLAADDQAREEKRLGDENARRLAEREASVRELTALLRERTTARGGSGGRPLAEVRQNPRKQHRGQLSCELSAEQVAAGKGDDTTSRSDGSSATDESSAKSTSPSTSPSTSAASPPASTSTEDDQTWKGLQASADTRKDAGRRRTGPNSNGYGYPRGSSQSPAVGQGAAAAAMAETSPAIAEATAEVAEPSGESVDDSASVAVVPARGVLESGPDATGGDSGGDLEERRRRSGCYVNDSRSRRQPCTATASMNTTPASSVTIATMTTACADNGGGAETWPEAEQVSEQRLEVAEVAEESSSPGRQGEVGSKTGTDSGDHELPITECSTEMAEGGRGGGGIGGGSGVDLGSDIETGWEEGAEASVTGGNNVNDANNAQPQQCGPRGASSRLSSASSTENSPPRVERESSETVLAVPQQRRARRGGVGPKRPLSSGATVIEGFTLTMDERAAQRAEIAARDAESSAARAARSAESARLDRLAAQSAMEEANLATAAVAAAAAAAVAGDVPVERAPSHGSFGVLAPLRKRPASSELPQQPIEEGSDIGVSGFGSGSGSGSGSPAVRSRPVTTAGRFVEPPVLLRSSLDSLAPSEKEDASAATDQRRAARLPAERANVASKPGMLPSATTKTAVTAVEVAQPHDSSGGAGIGLRERPAPVPVPVSQPPPQQPVERGEQEKRGVGRSGWPVVRPSPRGGAGELFCESSLLRTSLDSSLASSEKMVEEDASAADHGRPARLFKRTNMAVNLLKLVAATTAERELLASSAPPFDDGGGGQDGQGGKVRMPWDNDEAAVAACTERSRRKKNSGLGSSIQSEGSRCRSVVADDMEEVERVVAAVAAPRGGGARRNDRRGGRGVGDSNGRGSRSFSFSFSSADVSLADYWQRPVAAAAAAAVVRGAGERPQGYPVAGAKTKPQVAVGEGSTIFAGGSAKGPNGATGTPRAVTETSSGEGSCEWQPANGGAFAPPSGTGTGSAFSAVRRRGRVAATTTTSFAATAAAAPAATSSSSRRALEEMRAGGGYRRGDGRCASRHDNVTNISPSEDSRGPHAHPHLHLHPHAEVNADADPYYAFDRCGVTDAADARSAARRRRAASPPKLPPGGGGAYGYGGKTEAAAGSLAGSSRPKKRVKKKAATTAVVTVPVAASGRCKSHHHTHRGPCARSCAASTCPCWRGPQASPMSSTRHRRRRSLSGSARP